MCLKLCEVLLLGQNEKITELQSEKTETEKGMNYT